MPDNVDEAIVVGEDHHFDYDYDDDEAKVMGGSVDEYQTINEGTNISQTYFHHATYYCVLIMMRTVPRVMMMMWRRIKTMTIMISEVHHHDE